MVAAALLNPGVVGWSGTDINSIKNNNNSNNSNKKDNNYININKNNVAEPMLSNF